VSTSDQRTAIRFGVHGSSRQQAAAILRATGRDEDQAHWIEYDIADPFRTLRSGELDVLIVKYPLREPDLMVSRPVIDDPRAVVVGTRHPLAGRDSVSIEELADYEAFHCPGLFPAYVWDEIVPRRTPAGRVIRRAHPMTTVPRMIDLLVTTSAIHISFQSLDTLVPPSVRVVPIHDLPPAPVALCWSGRAELPTHVAEFTADVEAGVGAR
jgi:DNA-binding transcriptional LysR family regulator